MRGLVLVVFGPVLVFAARYIATDWFYKAGRFVHTGGNENPYVMFDEKTAQACYAGSLKGEDRIRDARRQATDVSLSAPSSSAPTSVHREGSSVPHKKDETPDDEIMRLAKEITGKPGLKEKSGESELKELPACRSLL
jgi:hypothetical protein